jgi:hypothetical protein
MDATTSIPTASNGASSSSASPGGAPAPERFQPLFSAEDPRPRSVSAPLAGIIVPILLSTVGMLLVFLGQWTNPVFLILACVAGVYSLFLCGLIAANRVRNRPVRPSWVAGVIVLTVYLGPATAMVGFVRLLDQISGIFDKAVRGDKGTRLPFDLDPNVNVLSAILLTVCATAFIIGCAVFWLEVVALRNRLGEIERAISQTSK